MEILFSIEVCIRLGRIMANSVRSSLITATYLLLWHSKQTLYSFFWYCPYNFDLITLNNIRIAVWMTTHNFVQLSSFNFLSYWERNIGWRRLRRNIVWRRLRTGYCGRYVGLRRTRQEEGGEDYIRGSFMIWNFTLNIVCVMKLRRKR